MSKEQEEKGQCTCPWCKLMEATKHSEAAKHVRGLEKEALLAARDLIDWYVDRLEKQHEGEQATKSEPK
jgi:hypothetical protein